MPTGLRPFTETILIVCLFSFFILMFINNFLVYTNPNSAVLSSDYGIASSANKMNESIGQITSAGNDIQRLLGSAKVGGLSIFLIFQAAFDIPIAIWKVFVGTTSGIFTALASILFPGLSGFGAGIFSFVVTVVITVLVIRAVFLSIKAIRTGESER